MLAEPEGAAPFFLSISPCRSDLLPQGALEEDLPQDCTREYDVSHTLRYPHMWALTVAIIYFGTFLILGYFAKVVLGKLMERSGAELSDVQAQAGANRRPRKVFLLGAWRSED